MSYTIPTPHKVRALRIPADGSPPHILTLETLMLDPDPFPFPESYQSLLSSLQKEESRHVPNLLVFWGARGWQRRNRYRIEYECKDCPKLEGHYFVFQTLEKDGFQVNPHLSNQLEEHHGDAFVLRAGEEVWQDEEDLDDIMDLLGDLRHHWLYPEFVDVDEEIVLCDIEQAIARLLLPHAEGSTEPAGQMDTDNVDVSILFFPLIAN